jgi:hypothetical protein
MRGGRMIAAVVSTYLKQLNDLPTCLMLVRKGVDRVIVCYNVQDGHKRPDPKLSPDAEQFAHEVIYTVEKGQYPGEGQCVKVGLESAISQGFEYTLKINGDVFFSKPENIPQLIDKLEDNDFISPQWHNHYRFGSTMMFFGKTDKLYEAYKEIPLAGKDQLERRWQRAFTGANLKWKREPYAEEMLELRDPVSNGMWGELLGFRHIHGSIDGQTDLIR